MALAVRGPECLMCAPMDGAEEWSSAFWLSQGRHAPQRGAITPWGYCCVVACKVCRPLTRRIQSTPDDCGHLRSSRRRRGPFSRPKPTYRYIHAAAHLPPSRNVFRSAPAQLTFVRTPAMVCADLPPCANLFRRERHIAQTEGIGPPRRVGGRGRANLASCASAVSPENIRLIYCREATRRVGLRCHIA
jgi:hypothetical protein